MLDRRTVNKKTQNDLISGGGPAPKLGSFRHEWLQGRAKSASFRQVTGLKPRRNWLRSGANGPIVVRDWLRSGR